MNDSTPGPSTFEERLRAGRFAITAEIAPPASCDAGDLRRKAERLVGVADAVNVTDGAGARASMSALAAATILSGMGIEPILQLTCRDRNRLALQGDLMGAAALGIRNLLLLTGDDPKGRRPARHQAGVRRQFHYADRDRAAPARRRYAAHRAQGRRQGRVLHRRRRHADRSAGRLAAERTRRQGEIRRAVRADAILHGCGDRAPLCGRARTCRAHAKARDPDRRHAAALGQVGRLDEEAPVRHHHFRCDRQAHGRRRRSGTRGRAHLRRSDRRTFDHPRHRRRAYHGAGE